jgi:hypothetical protein
LPDTESDYSETMARLSDIELVHEQSNNFSELLFFLITSESFKKESPNLSKESLLEVEVTILSMRNKIESVKTEVARRDLSINLNSQRRQNLNFVGDFQITEESTKKESSK